MGAQTRPRRTPGVSRGSSVRPTGLEKLCLGSLILMALTNAAVSFMVAEQFGEAVKMEAITRAAKYGRMTGTCHRMECPVLNGQLRTVTDYLSGLEEIMGYVVYSVSTSLG